MLFHFMFHNRRALAWRLLFTLTIFISLLSVSASYGHQSPNTLVFMDAGPKSAVLELQMPVSELELAFGHQISKDPATLITRLGPQLKEYIKAHIKAYSDKTKPWNVDVSALKMDKSPYADNINYDYWELVASVVLTPNNGESTRKFTLNYDVIMHQVVNHAALLYMRSDWETGKISGTPTQSAVISWNTKDNKIYPLKVNLEGGSWTRGFTSMVSLGIQHIQEGTDHLLFLLTLLLPAPLIVIGKRWAKAGGIRYSLIRILKIVTAFTIGHSITLIIGSAGLIPFPVHIIEVLIAISILVSAVHALKPIFPGKEMYVALGFGLIHGMAFAETLAGLHLDWQSMALSILGFNVGIELMQLFVIAVTIPWLIILSRSPLYKYIRVGGAMLASIAAIAWIIQRVSFNDNFITGWITASTGYVKWLVLMLAVPSFASLAFRPKTVKS
ncbi:HupE/UreJ family protein [Mucilaginibacter ginkgonis]|uniref:HupE/UreJ family protein n=1 Tax=Mucilaginibacter ginkgonis TaxID=2682091 RepID=A0A6I4HVW7_9SPHI|nr:HupE/UreJ family protein [Mucilaginibacter ginkgonis]QQL50227.1 HupE/UreJ family protein [Mucilaginibacter ginkgonis]